VKPITIYNIHTHIFTIHHVPHKFLPLNLVAALKNKFWNKIIRRILHLFSFFTKNDYYNRIVVMADAAENKKQEDILLGMMGYYPSKTRFGLLTLDMDYMSAGKAEQDYLTQLEQMVAIKRQYDERVIPFMSLDPRRPGLLELAKLYVDLGFGGFKLYPPLGFFPFDERLDEVYAFAESQGLPVITHCSPGGIYWRGKITSELRIHPKTGERLEGRNNAEFARNFSHPSNYQYVLEKFPKLKICLAHFGGGEEWDKYLENRWPPVDVERRLKGLPPIGPVSWLSTIVEMMEKYDTLYADIAYTAHEERFLPVIKVMLNTPELREKILYGSDCYMVLLDKSERAFSINVRGYLGEDDYRQMAEINPQVFLARNETS
jgi:predicted TIM-barrel fold metal-dependent hydrolase